AFDVGEVVRQRVAGRVDVLDHQGPARGAVALPQLDAVDAVVGREVELAVDVGEIGGEAAIVVWREAVGRAGVDVLHQGGRRHAAILQHFQAEADGGSASAVGTP